MTRQAFVSLLVVAACGFAACGRQPAGGSGSAGAFLPVGTGFRGETTEPPPTGDGTEPGHDARAIARWDAVPHQTFETEIALGVVAFHIGGMDRVEFSAEGGSWVAVREMAFNPATGVVEYWAKVRASDARDGRVEVRAVAYPLAGRPRVLEPIVLYANAGGTLGAEVRYVAISGSDTNEGTAERPFRTLRRAIAAVGDGGTVVILEGGTYGVESQARSLRNERWITVRAADGLPPGEVVIAPAGYELVRPEVARLRWRGVSFDFGKVKRYYAGDTDDVWFDGCEWFNSNGWSHAMPNTPGRALHQIGDSYATDCRARDMLYGFVHQTLARNCTMTRISGDALQNTQVVLNCRVEQLDGTIVPEHHPDLLQFFGVHENVIVYGVTGLGVKRAQNIFLDHDRSSFTDMAFVNVAVENLGPQPPYSQAHSACEHVLFAHVSNPGQLFLLRDDAHDTKQFLAHNVAFLNCVLEGLARGSRADGLPAGVSVAACHFVAREPVGTDATGGPVRMRRGPDGTLRHEGAAAEKLVGTGLVVRGFARRDGRDRRTVDRGAYGNDAGAGESSTGVADAGGARGRGARD